MTEVSSSSHEQNSWLGSEAHWIPKHLVKSAWTGHAPFAAWLVALTRPMTVVELGTHNGFSFFTFSEAAKRLGLSTHLYAIDTWVGDDQAGFYGDEVFQSVQKIAGDDYGDTTFLIRSYFSDAVSQFEDGSIDILHIDGRHRYEDVKEDFGAYQSKLSSRAVVVFHDTNEFQNGFGVHRFWDELSPSAPSFNFLHSHGLGVIALGVEAPGPLIEFIERANKHPDAVRSLFSELGGQVARFFDDSVAHAQVPQLEEQLVNLTERFLASEELLAEAKSSLEEMEAFISPIQSELEISKSEMKAVLGSHSWKVTAPLRRLRLRINTARQS